MWLCLNLIAWQWKAEVYLYACCKVNGAADTGLSFILGSAFWWDMHWHMWPFGFVAYCMSSEKNCLNKNRLWRGGNMYIHCAHLFGDKKMLQRYVRGGERVKSVYLLQMCAEACIWKQTASLLPANTPSVCTLFCFFMMPKGDLILSSFQEGRGFFCCITSTYPWHLLQLSNLAVCRWSGLWFHMWCWKHGLLLSHPCPVEGEGMLPESCITVSSSYIWSHGLAFQRPVIPKPFLLKILFRAIILTLTLRNQKNTFSEAVCVHKWAVKKAKIYFL